MKQFDHGIVGLRTDLSPSAVDSSSLTLTPSKSVNEDSFWGDCTVDLSFLSSDDQRSGLDDDDSLSNLSRDVDTTKEGELFEKRVVACSKLADECSKVAGDDKLDLSRANKAVFLSDKQSTHSDQDDSEDTPCWIGLGSRSVTSRRSIDDLSGFYKLNPLAPHFIPSNSKKNLDTNGKRDDEEGNASSLKKSLSSDFPSSSGEFSISDPLEDRKNDAARRVSILTNDADENIGFLPQGSVSKTVSMSDSRNEFQTSKKLDPLAPVFVPASAKLSPLVHEKQGAFDTNARSTTTLPSPESKSLNTLVETCSGEVGHSIKVQYPDAVNESGTTSSYNPWFESKVGITGFAKLGSSSNTSHGQRRLNPLAPQFSLADTKPKAYGYEKNQAADDLSLVVNTVGLSPYEGHNVVDADLAQSSVYVEHLVPNMSRGSSSLIASKTEDNFGSLNRFGVEPHTTLSVKDSMDFKLPLPFHVVETASSNGVKPFSGYGQKHSSATSSPSPKVDVKKLLTTMHGLSELLTLAHTHGSESSDSPNSQELDLVNSTVQNLNSYIKNNIQEQARTQSIIRHNSYDLKLSPNKSKLSIRDLQLPRANNMTVGLDVKRKEKYSMVSGETVPDSRLCEYVATKDNNFGQVVATSGYQQDRQGEEQIHPHALFYKSLWLKAEADKCLMVYETSLSNPTS